MQTINQVIINILVDEQNDSSPSEIDKKEGTLNKFIKNILMQFYFSYNFIKKISYVNTVFGGV